MIDRFLTPNNSPGLGENVHRFSGHKVANRLRTGLRFITRRVAERRVEARFLRRFGEYLERPTHAPQDQRLLLRAFQDSGGSSLTTAAQQAAAVIGKSNYAGMPDTLGIWNDSDLRSDTVDKLRKDGYAVLPIRLPEDARVELSQLCRHAPCETISDIPANNGLAASVDFNAPKAEKYVVDTHHLLSSRPVTQLMVDPGILAIAQEYLGSAPILDIATAWYSFPGPTASSNAAQLFHFDLDRIRWLKVFYFLTDVDADTGAHVFIPGSHSDGASPPELLKLGQVRFPDDLIEEHFPIEAWKQMTGPAGTILLEDTRGIHKGSPLTAGHRLVLQFQYSHTLFGKPEHLSTIDRTELPLYPAEPAVSNYLYSAFSTQERLGG